MARPRKIENADELTKHINGFIDFCKDNNLAPTDYQLCEYLDISPDTLERFTREPDKYIGYAVPLKKLTQFREDRLVQRLDSGSKTSVGDIFQLKQAKNGGYTDKQEQSVEPIKLEISLNGVKNPFG